MSKEAAAGRAKDDARPMMADLWPPYPWHLRLSCEGSLTADYLIGERCFSLFGALQGKNGQKLHATKMMSTVKVTFVKKSIMWANEVAVKRQKVVSQCAMQTA